MHQGTTLCLCRSNAGFRYSKRGKKAWRKEKDTPQRKEDVLLCRELLNEVRTYYEQLMYIPGG